VFLPLGKITLDRSQIFGDRPAVSGPRPDRAVGRDHVGPALRLLPDSHAIGGLKATSDVDVAELRVVTDPTDMWPPLANVAVGMSPTASVSPTNAIARFMFPLVCVVGSSLPRRACGASNLSPPGGAGGRGNKSGRETAEVAREQKVSPHPIKKGAKPWLSPPGFSALAARNRIVGA
jgi:hypothetical protein